MALILVAAIGTFVVGFVQMTTPFVIFCLGLFAVGITVEWMQLPSATSVSGSRLLGHLQESVPQTVNIRLSVPPSQRPIIIRDDIPDLLEASEVTLENTEREGEHLQGHYVIVAQHRAKVTFGDLHIRIQSPWGLLMRQFRIPATQVVDVWPDLRLTPAKQLALQHALLREGLQIRHLGTGQTEFAHIREYALGDDPRQVNWFATARRHALMRNVYEPEKGQSIILAIDCGRTMGILQHDGKTRLDLAIEAAYLTASAALENGDEVSLIAYSDVIQVHLEHLSGRRGLREMLMALLDLQATPVYSGPHLVADRVYRYHKRHALLLFFTDLTDLSANDLFEQNLRILEKRHTCVITSFTDETLESLFTSSAATFTEAAQVGVAASILNERIAFKERLRQRKMMVFEARSEVYSAALQSYIRHKNRAFS